MKAWIHFLAFLISALTAKAGVCKTFRWGTIDHTNELPETRTWVKVNDMSQTDIPVQDCPEGSYCSATFWAQPGFVTDSATCVRSSAPIPITNNTVLPGNMCTIDEQCFNHLDGASCKDGRWVTDFIVGSVCPDISGQPGHNYCPTGMYCSNKRCAPAKQENELCSFTELWASGLACISLNKDDNYTIFSCTKLNQLYHGQFFNMTYFYPGQANNVYYGTNAVCRTHQTYYLGDRENEYECRFGERNTNQTEKDLRRSEIRSNCQYQTWTSAGAGTDNPITLTDPPYCGFNIDDSPWWIKKKGDIWYNTTYQKIVKIPFHTFDCHINADLEDWFDAMQKVDKQLIEEFRMRRYEVDVYKGFPTVAHNDRWVAKGITNEYWKDKLPDFAMGHLGFLTGYWLLIMMLW